MTEILNDGRLEQVAVADLTLHPRNANQGDQGAIQQSIETTGWWGAVIAQRSTGRVLAGNHRLKAAKAAGLETVPVIYVDVDDEKALRILVADNRTAALATTDDAALVDILKDIAASSGLEGTGYDGDDLDDLLKSLDDTSHAYGAEKVTCPECGAEFLKRDAA